MECPTDTNTGAGGDALDLEILRRLQRGLTLSEDPYGDMAKDLGIDLEVLFDRVGTLVRSGVIRRLGASLDSRKFGFVSTLAAVRICKSNVEFAAQVIGRHVEVTHSYLRTGEFNIWFTLIAENRQRIQEILDSVRSALDLQPADLIEVPAVRFFKLDVRFEIKDPIKRKKG